MADTPGFDFRRTASQQYKNEELHIPSYAAPASASNRNSNPSEGPSRSTSHLHSVSEAASISSARYPYYADVPSEATLDLQTGGGGFQHDSARRFSSTADADASAIPIPGLLQPGRHSNDFGAASTN
ncbi:hypothetical protein KEM56_003613, partial [Ascosphaera pollenicola]